MTAVASVLAALLHAVALFTLQDPRIDESSGMVDLRDLVVITNDSGDGPIVYVVDEAGRTVGTTTWSTAPEAAVDVEALAPADATHVWVGDIGDNESVRSTIQVARVPVGRGDRTLDVPRYRLAYPDGPHNAETLLFARGRLWVVTKWIAGGTVYRAPRELSADRVNRLVKVTDVPGFLTDGAMVGPGRVVLRGYRSATLWTFPDFRPLTTFRLPKQQQGESISVGPGGRVLIGSEGSRSVVLSVKLPPASPARPSPTPTPTSEVTPSPVDSAIERHPWIPATGVAVVVIGLVLLLRRRPRD